MSKPEKNIHNHHILALCQNLCLFDMTISLQNGGFRSMQFHPKTMYKSLNFNEENRNDDIGEYEMDSSRQGVWKYSSCQNV